MIVCAGNNEVFPFATPMGVGLIDSAINLTQLCLFDKPESIIFVGSAGSYGNYNIFDIVESSSSSNIELSFFQNNSYTPIDNIIKTNNNTLRDDTIVNCSNYITTNMSFANEYISHGIGIENMEFYALVKVAQTFNIPIAGIFVITNYTNKDAHNDFLKNHKESIDRLIAYLEQKNMIVSR